MATLENYIGLKDGVSPVFDKISRSANTMASRLNVVSGATERMGNVTTTAAGKLDTMKQVFAGSFLSNIALRAIDSAQAAIYGIVAAADEYAGINARMALVSGSLENASALNDMIYESAQRARGGYMDMAHAVSQIAMSAKDAFPDPRDAVEFTEGIQKLFVIGGVSKSNQKNAMLQLTQGLASGQLQGDEFRSIAENAPIIENMIAEQMGVSRGALKQLAADGAVTAAVIKESILGNMDKINAQFEPMPKKWEDHFTRLTNVATKVFAPVFTRMSDLANSTEVRTLISGLEQGITALAPVFYAAVGAAQFFFGVLSGAFTWASAMAKEHTGIINAGLALMGLALLYGGIIATIWAQKTITAMLTAAAGHVAKTAAAWAEVAANIALAAAQGGLNAAIAACPITWIVAGIVLLVGIFYAAVAAVNHFAGTSISATGIILGAFAYLGASLVNFVIMSWNMFLALANFFGSVFQDPLGAAYNLFVDIWNAITEYVVASVNGLIGVINKIPGMTKAFGEFAKVEKVDLRMTRKEIPGATKFEPVEMRNIADIAQQAYNGGQQLEMKVLGGFKMPEMPKKIYDPTGQETATNTANTAKNTKGIKDAIDSSAADLKFLRDAAEREVVNKYTTATVKIDVGGVHAGDTGGNDFDGVVRKLKTVILESVENGAEAVKQ